MKNKAFMTAPIFAFAILDEQNFGSGFGFNEKNILVLLSLNEKKTNDYQYGRYIFGISEGHEKRASDKSLIKRWYWRDCNMD